MAIPNAQVPLLQPDGTLTLPWRLFMQSLSSASGITPGDLAVLEAAIAVAATEAASASAQAATALAEAMGVLSIAQGALALASVGLGDEGMPSAAVSGWLPLVTGAEPPVLVSDGAGALMTIAYAG